MKEALPIYSNHFPLYSVRMLHSFFNFHVLILKPVLIQQQDTQNHYLLVLIFNVFSTFLLVRS